MAAENDIFLNLSPIDFSRMDSQEALNILQKQMIDNFLQLKAWQEKQQENNTTFQATTDGEILNKLDGTTAPTVNDDSGSEYTEGSVWIDETSDKSYKCLDATVSAAVWEERALDNEAIHDNVAGEINAITEKASPTTGDWLIGEDGAASNVKKKFDVGNLPSSSFATDFEGSMSGATTLTTAVWGKIGFDGTVRDANSEFNTGTDEWVCGDDGTYKINIILVFEANTTGGRGVVISLNGDTTFATAPMVILSNSGVAGWKTRIPLSINMELSENDTIEIYGLQSSGGNLDVETISKWTINRVK